MIDVLPSHLVGPVLCALATGARVAALHAGGPRDLPVAFLFLTHSGYAKLGRVATAAPDGVNRSSGSSVRFPQMVVMISLPMVGSPLRVGVAFGVCRFSGG